MSAPRPREEPSLHGRRICPVIDTSQRKEPAALRKMPGTGMVAPVAPLLAWAGLAAGFLIALAAAVQMAGPVPAGAHVGGVIHLPGLVTAAIFALFGLALLVFIGDLVRRALSKEKAPAGPEPAQEPSRVPPWLRRM